MYTAAYIEGLYIPKDGIFKKIAYIVRISAICAICEDFCCTLAETMIAYNKMYTSL